MDTCSMGKRSRLIRTGVSVCSRFLVRSNVSTWMTGTCSTTLLRRFSAPGPNRESENANQSMQGIKNDGATCPMDLLQTVRRMMRMKYEKRYVKAYFEASDT